MRKPLTIQIEESVLESASARAHQQHRSVTEYIETLLRRDLDLPDTTDEVEIVAPRDAREYRAVPKTGETDEQTELADRALQRILDRAGH